MVNALKVNLKVTKYLTTLCLVAGGVLPIIVDVSSSHLLNPDWDSHARIHEAWRLSTNFLIFVLGIYFLWIKGKEVLSALISLTIPFGFVLASISMTLYEGTAVARGIPELHVLGVPINVFMFSSVFLIQTIVLILLLKKASLFFDA